MKTLIDNLSTAHADGGKGALRQLVEAITLRLRKSPVGISEYFDYGIWHRSITKAKADEFIGWKGSAELDTLLNNAQSRVLANDKLINHTLLSVAGFACPEPIATYTSHGRKVHHERVLTTHDEVRAFLREDVYPFYVKPISAGYGRGVLGVSGFENGEFRLFDGKRISEADFMKPFSFAPYRGMLFQKPMHAHPAVRELTGTDAVSCVRFICIVTPSGPVIHTAFWKITSGKNMLDNFSHGDFGNCLGAIDIATGKIVRAISRMGPGGQISTHPTTGKALIGFQLPDWQKAIELVYAASSVFPGLRLQNWDVALCPQGPVLLELNTESELGVPQAISGVGMMDERMRTILDELAREKAAHRLAMQAGVR